VARRTHARRAQHLGLSFRFAVALLWPFMRTMVRWDIEGSEALTDDPDGIIVAPNHLSWFDPLVVAYVMWAADRPPRFLGKEAVFRIPVLGRIIKGAGQIPVYRESNEAGLAIRDALTALKAGECVVVYPEGTITRDPDLWPMSAKTGAVRLALSSGRPLYPMAQWGANEVMAPYAKQFRILPRKTMRVVIGAPLDLTDLAGQPIDGTVLNEGGERLMDAITGLLAEIRDQTPPAERHVFGRTPQ
jgi:1-acyl-sn-glycerol-3-phosphate acyltransferase